MSFVSKYLIMIKHVLNIMVLNIMTHDYVWKITDYATQPRTHRPSLPLSCLVHVLKSLHEYSPCSLQKSHDDRLGILCIRQCMGLLEFSDPKEPRNVIHLHIASCSNCALWIGRCCGNRERKLVVFLWAARSKLVLSHGPAAQSNCMTRCAV